MTTTELKLGKLIVHSKIHKICKFENHVTRNDVIMTSLPKTMEKCGPPQTKQIIYHSKGIDESYQKMFWQFYDTRSPNMAMSRDPRSKFRKNFLGKVTNFLAEKLSTSEVIS